MDKTKRFDVNIVVDIEDLINIHQVLADTFNIFPTIEKQEALLVINKQFKEMFKDPKLKKTINDISTEMYHEKQSLLPPEDRDNAKSKTKYYLN